MGKIEVLEPREAIEKHTKKLYEDCTIALLKFQKGVIGYGLFSQVRNDLLARIQYRMVGRSIAGMDNERLKEFHYKVLNPHFPASKHESTTFKYEMGCSSCVHSFVWCHECPDSTIKLKPISARTELETGLLCDWENHGMPCPRIKEFLKDNIPHIRQQATHCPQCGQSTDYGSSDELDNNFIFNCGGCGRTFYSVP
jgi:hypothetical protein